MQSTWWLHFSARCSFYLSVHEKKVYKSIFNFQWYVLLLNCLSITNHFIFYSKIFLQLLLLILLGWDRHEEIWRKSLNIKTGLGWWIGLLVCVLENKWIRYLYNLWLIVWKRRAILYLLLSFCSTPHYQNL